MREPTDADVNRLVNAFGGLITEDCFGDSPEGILFAEYSQYDRSNGASQQYLANRIGELQRVSEGLEAKIKALVCSKANDLFAATCDVVLRVSDIHTIRARVVETNDKLKTGTDQVQAVYRLLLKRQVQKRLKEVLNVLKSAQSIGAHTSLAIASRQAGDFRRALEQVEIVLMPKTAATFERFASFTPLFQQARNEAAIMPNEILKRFLRPNSTKPTAAFARETLLNLWRSHTLELRLEQMQANPDDLSPVNIDRADPSACERFARTLRDAVISCIQTGCASRLTGQAAPAKIIHSFLASAAQSVTEDPVLIVVELLDIVCTTMGAFQYLFTVIALAAQETPKPGSKLGFDERKVTEHLKECMSECVATAATTLAQIIGALPMPTAPPCTLLDRSLQIPTLALAVFADFCVQFSKRNEETLKNLQCEEEFCPSRVLEHFKPLESIFHFRCRGLVKATRIEAFQELTDLVSQENWTRVPKGKWEGEVHQALFVPTLFDHLVTLVVLRPSVAKLSVRNDEVMLRSPFLIPTRWIARAEAVCTYLVGERSLSDSDEETDSETSAETQFFTLLTRKAMDIVHQNIQGLQLMPTLAKDVLAGALEIWDLVTYSVMASLIDSKTLETVFLAKTLAHPSPDCVGGPTLQQAHTIHRKQLRFRHVRHLMGKIKSRRLNPAAVGTNVPFPTHWGPRHLEIAKSDLHLNGAVECIVCAQALTDFARSIEQRFNPRLSANPRVQESRSFGSMVNQLKSVVEITGHVADCLYARAAEHFCHLQRWWGDPVAKLLKDSTSRPTEELLALVERDLVRAIRDNKSRLSVLAAGSLTPDVLDRFYAYVQAQFVEEAIVVLAKALPLPWLAKRSAVNGVNPRQLRAADMDFYSELFGRMWGVINEEITPPIDQVTMKPFEDYWQAHGLAGSEVVSWCRTHTKMYSYEALIGLVYQIEPKKSDARSKAQDVELWLCSYLQIAAKELEKHESKSRERDAR